MLWFLAIKKYVKVPRSLEGAKSILLLPLLGTILTGFVMLAVNIPMAAINTAMNDFLGGLGGGSAVLLGIVLGGMMAVDIGWTSQQKRPMSLVQVRLQQLVFFRVVL